MKVSKLVLAALLGAMTSDQVAEAVSLQHHHHHRPHGHFLAHIRLQTGDDEEDKDTPPGGHEPGANAEEAEPKKDEDDAETEKPVVPPVPKGPAGDISEVMKNLDKVKEEKAVEAEEEYKKNAPPSEEEEKAKFDEDVKKLEVTAVRNDHKKEQKKLAARLEKDPEDPKAAHEKEVIDKLVEEDKIEAHDEAVEEEKKKVEVVEKKKVASEAAIVKAKFDRENGEVEAHIKSLINPPPPPEKPKADTQPEEKKKNDLYEKLLKEDEAKEEAKEAAEEAKKAELKANANPIVEATKKREAAFERAKVEAAEAEAAAAAAAADLKAKQEAIVKKQRVQAAAEQTDEQWVTNMPEHVFQLQSRAQNFDSDSDSDSDSD
eukprot:CAMPEP_0170493498 /NCGR_PEP_ID=MMETSP0208-20121228/13989_1 /TAXON_ID=197538 /ORGANISM="Strombidium inclinatum, Strain S3" /LENGTH=374 /DNA_ID=CAMNT_0010769433 /DNA_START=11 /DNA_END=1135 /DNA_ORIENTATION=+